MGGGGGGSGRRHNEPVNNSIRTKPNVFLRQPSRNSSYETSGGGGGGGGGASSQPNQFIHHPRLQNERQSVPITVARPVAVTTNIHDTEQFPTLSSGSAVLNTSKLNFKEMVLKNTAAAAAAVTAQPAISPVEVVPVAPQKYSPVVSQKTLSSGNIFLSAFYGSSGGGGGDGDDGDGDDGDDSFGGGGGGGGGASSISSVLVDSCDRKYDNLYKY